MRCIIILLTQIIDCTLPCENPQLKQYLRLNHTSYDSETNRRNQLNQTVHTIESNKNKIKFNSTIIRFEL